VAVYLLAMSLEQFLEQLATSATCVMMTVVMIHPAKQRWSFVLSAARQNCHYIPYMDIPYCLRHCP
jgi:hypothetical protein